MDANDAAKTAVAPGCPFCHAPQLCALEHWEIIQEDEFPYQCENVKCAKPMRIEVFLTPNFTATAPKHPSDDAATQDED
jgi:hypothetical protein